MTDIDKFVLVPYERYQRLLKNPEEKKKDENDEVIMKKEEKEDNNEQNIQEKISNKNKQTEENSLTKVPQESLIQHRPPGLRQKKNKNKIKWYSLY